MDRRIVKPAQEGGRIWSPEHNRFVPAEGMEVQMTPYWLALESREDVVASDVPPEPEPEELSPAEAPVEAAKA